MIFYTGKLTRKGIKSQLQYLRRNFKIIDKLLNDFAVYPLSIQLQRKLWIIRTVHVQQLKMFQARTHQVEHRIASINQAHIRPIVRGKAKT
ncbi:hypothetical protein [Cyclobacterium marinum]|uniref:hypothetical protein n=1 Tax=Cyclobacterium marinum TaxID=104 RepID=UPI0030DAB2E5|tara:strand:+ start:100644 stop:100916 length:273 start_codon:yes stop_codon:yes gene_type:complete